ncbi:MAG: hypothetical protein EOP45_10165 [Sphingobacteriaceae bacterium]|nr:MAG: hypothetical protein EOP45_10165 [Sphingobacteriaceae bacterium]
MSEPILFTLTIPNIRLKQVLKLRNVLIDPQIICGARYPVICGMNNNTWKEGVTDERLLGTHDYPSTMEICRLTQLNEYEIAPEFSEPETYQAFRIDLEQLDRLLLASGHTTLTRYKSKPSMLEVSQEVRKRDLMNIRIFDYFKVHRGQMARGFLEVTEILDLDRADLENHVLLWKKRCNGTD